MESPEKVDAKLGIQAAEWLIRLEDTERPTTSRQQAEFFAWLRRSPQHLKAFFDAADLWRGLENFDAGREVDLEKLIAGRYSNAVRLRGIDSLREADDSLRTPGLPRWGRHRWLQAAGIAFLACAASIAGWKWLHEAAPVYSTSISQQSTFPLADGSVLHLNTHSRVRVLFSERERRVELLAGEALFSVAGDSKRPFLVHTGNATVRAIGTQFNVREQSGTTTVAVVDGRVQVSADHDSGVEPAAPALLAAGEMASVSVGRIDKRNVSSVADAVAWRQRRLVFHNASLAEVAAEFNRYNSLQLRVADDIGRSRRLTGIFSADHPQSLILYLEHEYPLQARTEGNSILISERVK